MNQQQSLFILKTTLNKTRKLLKEERVKVYLPMFQSGAISDEMFVSAVYDDDLSEEDKIKNVWLTTNQNSANLTSSVVIERCNGIFGSVYKDKQGISHYHYEPVIQGRDLSSNSFFVKGISIANILRQ